MMSRALILGWTDLFRPGNAKLVWTAIALTILLLVLLQAGIFWAIRWFLPNALSLPYLGQVAFANYLSWGTLLALPITAFLFMTPVASAFGGLFADRIFQAVENVHYPDLHGQPPDFWDEFLQSLVISAAALLIAVVLLFLAPFLGFLAPVAFFGANGWLLGRVFFQIVASRHLTTQQAMDLRRSAGFQVTGLGVIIAVFLTLPIVNILGPALAAASFAHLYHLSRTSG